MRKFWITALFFLPAASFSFGQQVTLSTQSPVANAQPARVKVYANGPGVTAPQLLPLNLPPVTDKNCGEKGKGKVVLSVIVDAAGRPRDITFLSPTGMDLDKIALKIAAADRFTPGTFQGAPVAVAQSLELDLKACFVKTKDEAGKKVYLLHLIAPPVQKAAALPNPPEDTVFASDDPPHAYRVGSGVTPPVLIFSQPLQPTDEAARDKFGGICVLSLIVDAQGMPQDVKVVRKLSYGLDENSLAAVSGYRFKPAMKDGEPVPVLTYIEIDFRLY